VGKIAIGCVVATCIGSACRWFDVPLPSPTRLQGALLVVAMTLGYFGTDWFIAKAILGNGSATTAPLCGGPTGLTTDNQQAQTGQPR
jgi:XapX domain-containing protein